MGGGQILSVEGSVAWQTSAPFLPFRLQSRFPESCRSALVAATAVVGGVVGPPDFAQQTPWRSTLQWLGSGFRRTCTLRQIGGLNLHSLPTP